jgi:aspartate/methionine/tyrosine aminotransferase
MLLTPEAPYLLWAKTRQPAAIDLAGSNLLHCSLDDLPRARESLDLRAPNDNGYAPLVDAIAQHYGVEPARVATATGCSGANFLVVAALAGAGDRVLVERPTYDPLIGACRLMGAEVVRFERRFESAYRLDLDDLARQTTPRTRLIVVTTPHNPSGVSLDRDELAALGALAERAGAHVLVDEVYLDAAALVRNEAPTASSGARLEGPFVVTNSLTKSYGLAGLRSGWIIAPAEIAERVRRTRDVVDNAGSGPSDRLAALAFTHLPRLADRARRLLSANLVRAREFFRDEPRLELARPPSSSVVFPRLAGHADTGAFVRRLHDQHGVAVAPGHFFEAPDHFRLSLAGASDVLDSGLAKIREALLG